jgi:hypothetical protein
MRSASAGTLVRVLAPPVKEGVKQVRMCPDCLSWSIYFLWLFVQSRAMTFTLPQALPLGFHAAMTPKPTVGARQ